VVNGTTLTWEPRELKDVNLLTGYGPGGIGFFEHGLVDTHFANRGRHGRLIQLLVDRSAHRCHLVCVFSQFLYFYFGIGMSRLICSSFALYELKLQCGCDSRLHQSLWHGREHCAGRHW